MMWGWLAVIVASAAGLTMLASEMMKELARRAKALHEAGRTHHP